ncbi:MAG: DUF4097 family beta strand repeat-containing protein [Gemmatimonadaceae bacterium]
MLRRLIPVSLAALAAAAPALAQTAPDFRWSGTAAAGTEVSVSNVSGNVTITASTTGRVEVLGTKRGSGGGLDRLKADVQQTSRGIAVCVLYNDNSYCDDNGYHSNDRGRNNRDDNDWGNARMDLEVAIPSNLQVAASSVSGDVSVTGAQGDVRANTVSGQLRLDGLHATSVRAGTVSGDMEVRITELTGQGDLSFNTVSGDLTLFVPRTFSADLSMSSVSGDVNSDFALTVGSSSRMRRGSVDARIGNGGRRLDVHTVSGNLRLREIN